MTASRFTRFLLLSCLLVSLALSICSADTLQYEQQISDAGAKAIGYYQDIHRHPELGKHEVKTAEYIRARLRSMGYSSFVTIDALPTATVAVLDTGRPGPVVCFRADIDAIRLTEKTGLPFASEVPGVMHACGHDAHTAIALGTADVLMKLRDKLNGKVVFLFQPAEECAGGADDVVADKAFGALGITKMYALHVFGKTPVGTIETSPGPILAGSCSFTLKITGKESHAALPHEGDDVVVSAAEIAAGLTKLPARKLDVTSRPCVISVTYFNSGDQNTVNRIPSEAVIRGTIRSYEDIESAKKTPTIKSMIESYLAGESAARGVKSTIEYKKGAPPLSNDADLYAQSVSLLRDVWPELRVKPAERSMTSEDFAFYTAKYPCLYIGLGVEKDGFGGVGVHQDTFTLHTDAIYTGIKLFTLLALGPESTLRPNP